MHESPLRAGLHKLVILSVSEVLNLKTLYRSL